MSFGFWLDSDLTVGFSYTKQLIENTDLSGEPQTFMVFFGSPLEDRLLQAVSDPGIDNIVLTPTDILPEWEAATDYVVGDRVQAVGGDGFVYRCTDAGTSGGSEPTWPIGGIGSTVIDGGVIWTKFSEKHEITEIKLALSEGGLTSAVAGDPLDIGTEVEGGTANAVEVWIRVGSVVTTSNNNTGHEELDVYINEVIETAV